MNASKPIKLFELSHLILSLFFSILWTIVFINSFHNRLDAFPSYVAADLFLDGEYEHIYLLSRNEIEPSNPEYQLWEQRRDAIFEKSTHPVDEKFRGTQYIYHPAYLPLVSPIVALLDIDSAHWLLFFAQVLSLLFLIRVLCFQLKLEKKFQLFLVYGSFFSYPVLQGIAFGQNTILIPALLLLSLHFANLTGKKALLLTISATIVLALIKPWSILLAAFIMAAAPIKTAIVLLLSLLLVFFVFPYFLLPELLHDYAAGLVNTSKMAFVHYENFSLLAGLIRVFEPQWRLFFGNYSNLPMDTQIAYSLSILITLTVGLALTLKILYLRFKNPDTKNIQALWPLALAVSLIPLSVTWAHYYLLAIPFLIQQFENSSIIIRLLISFVISIIGLPIIFFIPNLMDTLIVPQTSHVYLALILFSPIGLIILLSLKRLFFYPISQ